eukprot:4399457-Heterocapsa_arctica.AAC.1
MYASRKPSESSPSTRRMTGGLRTTVTPPPGICPRTARSSWTSPASDSSAPPRSWGSPRPGRGTGLAQSTRLLRRAPG